MHISKIPHYARKVWQLGPTQTVTVVAARLHAWFFEQAWRKKAAKKESYSWQEIMQLLGVECRDESFLMAYIFSKKNQFLSIHQHLLQETDQSYLLKETNELVKGTLSILGSKTQQFDSMPWHQDFRLAQTELSADCLYDAQLFYKDLEVKPTLTEALGKDIKVPWELSRLQHLFVIACAYHIHGDQKFKDRVVYEVHDWMMKNPFLLGPNWVCPMEVGIRLINLIWIMLLCLDEHKDKELVELLVHSILHHMYYLEHTWEIYDGRTSNHYLSDLIGYFYCCMLLGGDAAIAQKRTWCQQEIEREMKKQVFEEGASYEGSTCYHRLVTELFWHADLLADSAGIPMSSGFKERLNAMFSFLNWATPVNGKLIMIGDNDSGFVSARLSPKMVYNRLQHELLGNKTYAQFGISFIKTRNWHVSLRHHAYQSRQPSGHFHNDVGSITISYKGEEIFVDPGSYVYTASSVWRNRFRSSAMHNSFGIAKQEPIELDDRLFALELPDQKVGNHQHNDHELKTEHWLYQRYKVKAIRKVHLDPIHDHIAISDSWQVIEQSSLSQSIETYWNFTLAPTIHAIQHANGILLTLPTHDQFLFSSNDALSFELIPSWVSYEYGSKEPTVAIRYKTKMQPAMNINFELMQR